MYAPGTVVLRLATEIEGTAHQEKTQSEKIQI